MKQAENIMDLSNRTAIVIGGTSGLRRATANGLARSSANVIASGRREELIEELCAEIEKTGRGTLRQMVDVSIRESIDRLRDAVLEKSGSVDILVKAAIRAAKNPTAEVKEVGWQAILDTNLNGTLRACQSSYEPLKRFGRGRIINIASLTSFVAFHQATAYGASKAAVLALTRSLSCEWAAEKTCVNAVVPGVSPTELNAKLLEGTERGREILTRTPIKPFGRLENKRKRIGNYKTRSKSSG